MSNYKFPLEDYCNKQSACVSLLSNYLNQGSFSLMLGAGASAGFGLPNWEKLVIDCATDGNPNFVRQEEYSNIELKKIIDEVKKNHTHDYIELIKRKLYNGVEFDFSFAKKDLLIAITSLIIGKARGNVRNMITYNFDSVLEWYLNINGIKTNVTSVDNILLNNADLNIIHLHGFIPHSEQYGKTSTDVIFSKKEFEQRQIGKSYWKDLMNEFFRRNIFLTVGLSPTTLLDDICPYLIALNKWYDQENIKRNNPFGIAFLTPGNQSENCFQDLLDAGIIPCIIEIENIPNAIFSIAQGALINYP